MNSSLDESDDGAVRDSSISNLAQNFHELRHLAIITLRHTNKNNGIKPKLLKDNIYYLMF